MDEDDWVTRLMVRVTKALAIFVVVMCIIVLRNSR